MIPAYLLNATISFFRETNPTGTFGQPTKVLVGFATARCRADMASENRVIQSGSFEQRKRMFRVFVNELPPEINTKTWVEVTGPGGFGFVGQVDSVAYPGMMGHHSELVVIEQPPSLPEQGGTLEMIRP